MNAFPIELPRADVVVVGARCAVDCSTIQLGKNSWRVCRADACWNGDWCRVGSLRKNLARGTRLRAPRPRTVAARRGSAADGRSVVEHARGRAVADGPVVDDAGILPGSRVGRARVVAAFSTAARHCDGGDEGQDSRKNAHGYLSVKTRVAGVRHGDGYRGRPFAFDGRGTGRARDHRW